MRKPLISITLIFLYLNFFVVNAQENDSVTFGTNDIADYFFAFSLTESASGLMMHFALITPGVPGKRKVQHISLDDFLYQASGKARSMANPKNKNFFKEYEIKKPEVVVHDLWKLRYKQLPYGVSTEEGWAVEDTIFYLPSKEQMSILKKYGMNRMGDYIVGKNAFKLLKNMEDSTWINNYKMGVESN